MTSPIAGGVDCDLHPAVPHLTSLLPYMNDYWRDQVTTRGMTDLVSQSYPTNSPISARPDWRPAQGKPGSSLADMQTQALDRFGVSYGICNPLYGVQMVFSEDMQDAFCRALNDWLVKEWLDKDARLRGSIVIPTQSVEKSVAEIERCAQGQALRPGADAGHGRRAAGQTRAVADLCRRRAARPRRSASMPAAPITTRRPRSAGAPITSRIMSPRRRRSRPSSPA